MKTKTIILTLAALLLPLVGYGQESELPTATLQVGEQTTIYSGPGSYIQALTAAREASINGQSAVITLSSGTFDGADTRVRSNISIYGMGWHDEADGVKKTFIRGNMVIGTREANVGATENVHVEGVFLEGNIYLSEDGCNRVKLVRNRFTDLAFYGKVDGLIVRNCHFSLLSCYYYRDIIHTNVLVQNSVFNQPQYWNAASESVFDHDIILRNGNIDRSYYSNCIMNWGCEGGGTMNNCVVFNYSNLPTGTTGTGNYFSVNQSAFWADGSTDLTWSEDRLWELATPESYAGTDGTQVGIYGGDYPLSRIPVTPRITRSEIDSRVSAQGKLKLHIEATAQPVIE